MQVVFAQVRYVAAVAGVFWGVDARGDVFLQGSAAAEALGTAAAGVFLAVDTR